MGAHSPASRLGNRQVLWDSVTQASSGQYGRVAEQASCHRKPWEGGGTIFHKLAEPVGTFLW